MIYTNDISLFACLWWGRVKSQIITSFHQISDRWYLIFDEEMRYLFVPIIQKCHQKSRFQIFSCYIKLKIVISKRYNASLLLCILQNDQQKSRHQIFTFMYSSELSPKRIYQIFAQIIDLCDVTNRQTLKIYLFDIFMKSGNI